MTTKNTTTHRARPTRSLLVLQVARRRRQMIIHLSLDARWFAQVLLATAAIWAGLDPVLHWVRAVTGLP